MNHNMFKLTASAFTGFLLAAGLLSRLWRLAPYPLIDGPTYESLLEKVFALAHQFACRISLDRRCGRGICSARGARGSPY